MLLALAVAFTVAWSFLSLAPWVPARKKDLKRINKLANLKKDENFYDLGCGNGRVVMYMGQQNPDCNAIGIELAWPFYFICQLRRLLGNKNNIKFKFANLFSINLRSANVVYLFGLPEKLTKRLREKFEHDLRPGTRIISYTFPIQGWQPKQINQPSENDIKIYYYEI